MEISEEKGDAFMEFPIIDSMGEPALLLWSETVKEFRDHAIIARYYYCIGDRKG